MKRKTPLRAKTPMARGSSSLRRAALNRQSQRSREAAKSPRKPLTARPAVVTAEERRARKLVAERSGQRCEGCGLAGVVLHWAHRKARSQGGQWAASNGLHLCARCHLDDAHGGPEWARGLGWMVRRAHDPLTRPARLHGHGWVLLTDDGGRIPCDPPADYPNPDNEEAA